MKIISFIALLAAFVQLIVVQGAILKEIRKIDYSTPEKILGSLGVPGYYKGENYDYASLALWNSGPVEILPIWENLLNYMTPEILSKLGGSNNDAIRKTLKKKYNDNGKKLLVIAYGKDSVPVFLSKKAIVEADALADFVQNYDLDGVQVDYQGFYAQNGKIVESEEIWLNEFLARLRFRLPTKLIVDPEGNQIRIGDKKILKRISVIPDYSSPDKILEGLAVPTYDKTSVYDYLCIDSWNSMWGPVQILQVWQIPMHFLGRKLGSNHKEAQKNLQKLYNDHGKKVLAFAFGQFDVPTFLQMNPAQVAQKLADFVNNNYLDGAVIDYQDLYAKVQKTKMTNNQWLSKFLSKAHELMKDKIIIDSLVNPI